ncbi:hypothetical protein CHS0354_042860 [Potamilus streckersoni]|uniref:Uncharacterized protein n=1 Tax=Potamilus streckersoni TaxID=2493646 RepID=A0AAE0T4V4_9BIVA|nr:hypothetical protein CHS0354_042860 [Potamilus streckersoni]
MVSKWRQSITLVTSPASRRWIIVSIGTCVAQLANLVRISVNQHEPLSHSVARGNSLEIEAAIHVDRTFSVLTLISKPSGDCRQESPLHTVRDELSGRTGLRARCVLLDQRGLSRWRMMRRPA